MMTNGVTALASSRWMCDMTGTVRIRGQRVSGGQRRGPLKIDATPPTVHTAATTQPKANGWYDANVMLHFACSDALRRGVLSG